MSKQSCSKHFQKVRKVWDRIASPIEHSAQCLQSCINPKYNDILSRIDHSHLNTRELNRKKLVEDMNPALTTRKGAPVPEGIQLNLICSKFTSTKSINGLAGSTEEAVCKTKLLELHDQMTSILDFADTCADSEPCVSAIKDALLFIEHDSCHRPYLECKTSNECYHYTDNFYNNLGSDRQPIHTEPVEMKVAAAEFAEAFDHFFR